MTFNFNLKIFLMKSFFENTILILKNPVSKKKKKKKKKDSKKKVKYLNNLKHNQIK
jgi:hypothetical protein